MEFWPGVIVGVVSTFAVSAIVGMFLAEAMFETDGMDEGAGDERN